MLRLRDIMTRDVVTMSPELGLRDAMTLLASRHIGGAPVVANGRVIGIISSTDLLEFAASLPGVPRARTGEVELDALEELPDWEEGTDAPAAWFTEMWSDAGAEVEERFAEPAGPEWNVLEEHTIAEAMSRVPLCALAPDVPVTAAADYMRRGGVHRILVMEGNRLLGIVSTMDIARAVADGRLITRTFVFGGRTMPDERGWAVPDRSEGDAVPEASDADTVPNLEDQP